MIEQFAISDTLSGSETEGFDTSISESGIDTYFLELAHEQKKDIKEIESAKYQYGIMAKFSDSLQKLLLESAIESYKAAKDTSSKITAGEEESDTELLLDLMDAWKKGDAEKISSLLQTEEDEYFDSEKDKKLFDEYYKAIYTDRDKNMTDYAVNALKSGKEIFICVGAAHVVAEGAMADQLKALGYTVESVK